MLFSERGTMASRTGFVLGLLLLMSFTDAKCPTLFETFNMACYYYGNNPVPGVQQAVESCTSLGGYLININAELEYSHTIERLQAQYNIYDGYWVGGVLKSGYWVWQRTTATGFVDEFMDPSSGHYNWGPGEPGSYQFPVLEGYAAIMVRGRAKPYHLYSERGDLKTRRGMSYICEADWTE